MNLIFIPCTKILKKGYLSRGKETESISREKYERRFSNMVVEKSRRGIETN